MLYTMLHNRRLYSKVVSTCYITCLYTSNSYMACNITGGYIARWYITCYITFRFYMLFRQLFNMLNRTLWSARAFPASLPWLTPSPLPTVYHFCSAVFIRLQTRHRPPPPPLPHPPPQPPPWPPAPPSVLSSSAAAATRAVGGTRVNQVRSLRATYWSKRRLSCLLNSLKALAKRASSFILGSVVLK